MMSFLMGVIVFGIIFGIFLAGGLFFRKENHFANIILTLLMLLLSAALTETPFILLDRVYKITNLLRLYISNTLLLSPLFYLYILAFISRINRLKMIHILHLIPSLLVLVIPEFLSSEENTILMEFYIPVFLHFQGILYLISMFVIIKKYRGKIKDYFSEISKLRLTWLKFLIVFWALVISVSLILTLFTFYNIYIPRYFFFSTSMLAILFFYFTAYFTLRQPELFSKIMEMENALDISLEEVCNINVEADKVLFKQLVKHMDDAKPYRENDLTLARLAADLSIATYKLSKVIASGKKYNFYSFVNSYRVKDVKFLLSDKKYKDRTVMDLAFESGFNSKSNFNEIFKKYEGVTPSQFRKQLNK